MTMAMAWVRTLKGSDELIFASDSRLRDAGYFDCGPKIFPLLRGDAAICFAGNTSYAYPIINHVIALSEMHFKLKTRAKSLSDLKHTIIDVLNNMTPQIGDILPGTEKVIDSDFIFGGYCWKSEEYKFWRMNFNIKKKKFTLKKANTWDDGSGKKKLLYIGDYQDEAMKRLEKILRQKNKIGRGGFDYEPFEVLRDMLREHDHTSSIGGAPQIVKVYKSLNCIAFPVYWPDRYENKLFHMGRPLLEYEKHNYLNFDPDSCELEMPE